MQAIHKKAVKKQHQRIVARLRSYRFTRKRALFVIAFVVLASTLATVAALDRRSTRQQEASEAKAAATVRPKPVVTSSTPPAPSGKAATTAAPPLAAAIPATGSPGTCANRSGGPQPKGMWVWQSAVATDAGQRAALLSFAGTHRVRTVYLESEKLINTDQASLASFTKEAKQHCIEVELLFGAPDWAFTSNHAYAVSLAQKAVAFASRAEAPPVGVHFDVEPYNLPEYKADVNSGANQYLDLLEKIRAVTSPSKLYFAKAIPLGFEFQSVNRGGQTVKLSHAAIERVDRVMLMDYRDTSNRIIDDASDEMQYAASKGKKVVIGVETACDTGEVHTITFCEEGKAALETALLNVSNAFGSNSAFAGMAVHDYAAYKPLKP